MKQEINGKYISKNGVTGVLSALINVCPCHYMQLLLLSAVVVICRQATRVGAVGVMVGYVISYQRNKN